MKLQQLRYVVETVRRNLNVSEAAEALFTSQPGVSKQIRLLEEEIGVAIFIRSGKRIVAVTRAGKAVVEMAEQILRDVQKIKNIGHEFSQSGNGILTIAASYTHARYILPSLIADFKSIYPNLKLFIRQGTPEQVAEMVYHGEVDFAISSEMPPTVELKRLLCTPWDYILLLPPNHDLNKIAKNNLTLNDLMDYPLITYDYATHNRSVLGRALAETENNQWRWAFTCGDNDLLKTYVRLGLGIGILDKVAYQIDSDQDLNYIEINHLFEASFTQLIFRNDVILRHYDYDFIQRVSPNLNRERVDKLLYAPAIDDFSI